MSQSWQLGGPSALIERTSLRENKMNISTKFIFSYFWILFSSFFHFLPFFYCKVPRKSDGYKNTSLSGPWWTWTDHDWPWFWIRPGFLWDLEEPRSLFHPTETYWNCGAGCAGKTRSQLSTPLPGCQFLSKRGPLQGDFVVQPQCNLLKPCLLNVPCCLFYKDEAPLCSNFTTRHVKQGVSDALEVHNAS